MKLNMIVVMTTWLPKRACSHAGMRAQAAPNSDAPRIASGNRATRAGSGQSEGHDRNAQSAQIGLPLPADIKQAGMERNCRRPGR
jgi:hypothetical protein